MIIRQFLNLNKEEVDNNSNKIVKLMAKSYNTEDRRYKTDEENIVIPRISHM